MYRSRLLNAAIYIGLTVIFLTPRLAGIGSFVTLDEPSWLSQGANFYYALGQREFQNTVYEYQPAVTTMEIIALAMHLYFPEYRGFGQGYLDYERGLLDPFMQEHGKNPLILLIYARTIQIFVLLILFLLLYFLLQKILPKSAAVFALAFAAFDPFYLSQARLTNHESMLTLFVMVSLIALVVYLFKENKFAFLALSGIAAGFAQLTKSSAIAMLAAIGVILLWKFFQERRSVLSILKTLGIWLVVLIATYFIFWPGMWVAPGKMLYEVYGNAVSYAFQGARLTITENLNVSDFSLNAKFSAIGALIKILLYRTTLLTWIGVLLSLALPFIRNAKRMNYNRLLFTLLLINSAAFILLFGVAQGRDSPHYILTSYLSLNLLAGLGWFALAQKLAERFLPKKIIVQYALLIALLATQALSAVKQYPYYFTYRNPLLAAAGWYAKFPHFPYCEGLELAAHYLASLPDAKDATVFSYYGRGCFSYYYPGPWISYRPYYSDGEHTEDLLRNLRASQYLIVYYANQGQLAHHLNFVNVMAKEKPFHVIWLNGYEYVRIYKVSELSPEIDDALSHLK